jgi:drug/metabolite transporter (DMT)-like permease
MELTGVAGPLILVASALLHAAWNALLKREPDKAAAAVVVFGAATAITAACVPFVSGRAFATPAAWAWAAGAGVFEGAYIGALTASLARAPLGLAYTIARGGAMLIVWPVSVLILGERAGALSLLGAVAVGAGLAAAQFQPGKGAEGPPKLGWAWACAACIAGYHLCYDRAIHAGAHTVPLFALSLAVALPMNLAMLSRAQRRGALAALRQRPGPLLAAGTLTSASFLCFLAGLALSGPGAALTLRNTSVVFAQIFAVALGERVGRRQVAGALLVAAGATMVALQR